MPAALTDPAGVDFGTRLMRHVRVLSLAKADHCDVNDPVGIVASLFGTTPFRCKVHFVTNLYQGGSKDA